ncbi:2-amino-4-hydroxy-6-hydroxymethyldihydropteridine pyrophosphokinase [Corynebacterium kalinowskii]|uniref:2-amino-4-hydroxy-6-hydroxymethyldihydropteridine diphosphokinase n=1 Tax=Corynebacterium kalinowskii TaxID=2675216 RepID=A0A6B8W0K8_9CORY|nr:2-amino-4-hydroxy-6-hydroxymethyldihydropteridine diphosphokinase [Corynebacterium kalinowskii]QGU01258.1 2-amino-4-hydroxy-6-hydroxymethyldihydropteridine pyrophosphokinase [Corynebacterium kalinowskii]
MRAVLSIGSNMDDRDALLRSAYDYFAPELVAASSIYSTPPWGPVSQNDFLNAILIIDTDRTPMQLLAAAQEVENAADRRREVRWGPRTLDIDIVQCLIDDVEVISADPVLTLPHPWAQERAFVLAPWLEADPEAELRGEPVRALLEGMDTSEVRKVSEF